MSAPSHVRVLAQTDPVPNLTANYGEVATRTRRHVADLEASLRDLDRIREQLAEKGVTVDVDLGQIGNAAAAARRDLDRTDERPRFVMPGN